MNTDLEGETGDCIRTQFLLPDCGYFLKLGKGTVVGLNCAKIKHGSLENKGYKQYGVALTYKKRVVTGCRNELAKKFGFDFTIKEPEQ